MVRYPKPQEPCSVFQHFNGLDEVIEQLHLVPLGRARTPLVQVAVTLGAKDRVRTEHQFGTRDITRRRVRDERG